MAEAVEGTGQSVHRNWPWAQARGRNKGGRSGECSWSWVAVGDVAGEVAVEVTGHAERAGKHQDKRTWTSRNA